MLRRIPALVVLGSLFAAPSGGAELLVANATDLVNGNASTVEALIDNPGPDGISLREAFNAANNTPGPHTITFARALAGATISLESSLRVLRDGLTLAGLLTPDGQPNIRLDGDKIAFSAVTEQPVIAVYASRFTITGCVILRARIVGIRIHPGEFLYPRLQPADGSSVRDIRIERNVFDNTGASEPQSFPTAIRILTSGGAPGTVASDTTIAGVSIANNDFRHIADSGIIVNGDGQRCTVQDLVITGNRFEDVPFHIELAFARGRNNRIVGTRIIGNKLIKGTNPFYIGTIAWDAAIPAEDNVIDGTVVRNNEFASLDIRTFAQRGATARRNVVRNTEISNNVIYRGGVGITGGGEGAFDNRVEDVRIVNNTIITQPLAGLGVQSNVNGGSGNRVVGVTATNTIFGRVRPGEPTPEEEIAGEVTVDQLSHCITSLPRFAGRNGNLTGDPGLVSVAQGDLRLRPGSPAIDAGTSENEPGTDFDGRPRHDEPSTPNTGSGPTRYVDIGAYEYNPAPVVSRPPASRTVPAGDAVVLSIVAAGASPMSYQWYKDGARLPAATAANLELRDVRTRDAGNYIVTVTNGSGATSSTAAVLTVTSSRLVNLSTRALVREGDALTPAFVLAGQGSKRLLIRGVGPTLGEFGIEIPLDDPRLQILPQGAASPVGTNDDWNGTAELHALFQSIGAFPLLEGGRDAAMQLELPANAGGYSIRIEPGTGRQSGLALAEVYDLDPADARVRFGNLSARGFVGTGENVLTAGLVIRGNVSKRVLIRAIGPGLRPFGVANVLADPELRLIPAGQTNSIRNNDNWGGGTGLTRAFGEAGAFSIAADSRDAAVVETLSPGGYTVMVSGVAGTTGDALIEFYDLDP